MKQVTSKPVIEMRNSGAIDMQLVISASFTSSVLRDNAPVGLNP